MALSLNKPKLDNLADEIWKSAERLRGKFKAYEYQNVILPIIVIRRLECVLIKWREDKAAEVVAKRPKLTEKELAKLVKGLETSTAPFSNKTNWTLRRVYEEDHTLLEENFRDYINGFSKNVDDIIEHFNYRATIGLMVKNNRLAPILNQYKELELGPDKLAPLEMGYIYEELLRRFSEQSGEEAGDHFTPREVIRLMVELLDIPIPDRHISIYDPACGTGGMLSVAKEHLLERAATSQQKANVEKYVTVHGQELSPTNYAICQADLLIKNDRQATVHLGNSLIPHDPHSKERGDQWPEPKWHFHRMLSNPPFGVKWGGEGGYGPEVRKLEKTRYKAGIPPIKHGELLFLQTMLAKMVPPEGGGSRIAVVFNGSPLSNGDCGSGESEIRRWVLENDWLDAIVMLPDQLFYNTGIFTYIWLLRNDKPTAHKGRVMLIDGRQQFEKEPKSFGNKRNRMTDAHRAWIEERYRDGWMDGYSDGNVKIFRHLDFAYHKVSVVFSQFDEQDKPAVITEPYEKAFTVANLNREQDFYESELIFRVLMKVGNTEKIETLTLGPKDSAAKKFKELLKDNPEIVSVEWTHRHYVKDDEYIPQGEDIELFLKREIAKPIIRWEDSEQLGYEIQPNKYFYRYQPPIPAKDLLAEFWRLEKQAEQMLEGLAKVSGQYDSFLYALPNGWTFDRLKDVVALRNEKTAELSAEEDYLELEDIEAGTGKILSRRNTLEVESAVTIFKKGDILFGKLRPYLEKYYMADFDGKCTGEILAFNPKKIDNRFLFYCVASRWFIERCNALAYGAKMPRVSWPTQLAQFNVPLPPLYEQEQIATYLDASCAVIDAAVATKRRQNEMLDGLRREIVQRAVTRGLKECPELKQTGNLWMNEVPSNWELVSLKRVSEVQNGLTLGKAYEGPLIERPYLRVANVQSGHLNLEDVTTIEVPAEVARRVELRPDDVLMTEGGDLDKLGRGTIWSGEISDCLHQNHIFAIRCFKHKLLPSFLAYLTASRYGRDYFEATGKRTTNLASTNSTKVGLFPIPRPSISEQRTICQFLDEKLKQIAQIMNGIEAQIATLSAYRKSLIHECVIGQRRVPETDRRRERAHA